MQNGEEALKTALSKLMEDGSLRSEYGTRARDRVCKEYNLPVIFRRYVRIWEDLAMKGK